MEVYGLFYEIEISDFITSMEGKTLVDGIKNQSDFGVSNSMFTED